MLFERVELHGAKPASQTVPVELRPSTELTRRRLAELFTAAYEDYYVPFQVDEARLAHMVDAFDLALDRSVVAWDGDTPVGLANLGLRGEQTWLGGVGVVKLQRRSGIGEQLTRALLGRAREAGAVRMLLEVITQNEPAIALYENLGFRTTRELEVLTLTAADEGQAADMSVPEARRLIAAVRSTPEPWQRDDATVDNLDGVAAIGAEGAAAVYRMEGRRVNLLQAGGEGAGELVAGLRALGPMLALNYPVGDPVTVALHDAGATELLRQLEMAIDL
jgi:GNAT superfamily N-acetyltransferase